MLYPCIAKASGNKTFVLNQLLVVDSGDSILLTNSNDTINFLSTKISGKDERLKEKLLAGFLSFPFPMGFLGAHRILLGTKPWVPVVYVATFGGCFGLLPLVDFCVIMLSDDVTKYENNPNIFMWVK